MFRNFKNFVKSPNQFTGSNVVNIFLSWHTSEQWRLRYETLKRNIGVFILVGDFVNFLKKNCNRLRDGNTLPYFIYNDSWNGAAMFGMLEMWNPLVKIVVKTNRRSLKNFVLTIKFETEWSTYFNSES